MLLAVYGVGCAHSAPPTTGVTGVADFMAQRAASGFSGVAVVAEGDRILFSKAYGHADCARRGPMRTDDVFLIGSITKVFTRTAVGVLVSEGRLGLQTPLANSYPDAPADKRSITIEQLLAHRSGLDDILDADGRPIPYSTDWDYLAVDRGDMEDRLFRSTLLFAPGTDRRYSNAGYAMLAAIIERASGQPYETYVRARVLKPAGMLATGYVGVDWSKHRLVDGCLKTGERWRHPVTDRRWMADGPSWNLRGNGGMLGTAGDLLRWVRTYIKRAPPIGLRTGRSKTFETRASSAAGGNGIFNAVYLWLERRDLTVILLSNQEGHPGEAFLLELAKVALAAS